MVDIVVVIVGVVVEIMSFRRNKATVVKCLIVVILLLIGVPLLLRTSNSSNDNDSSGLASFKHEQQQPHRDHESPQQQRQQQQQQSSVIHLIDWHDRDAFERERQRKGPGEQGSAYILTAEEEKLKSPLYQVNGFNALASDRISLDRSLNDIRHPDCKTKTYSNILPSVSIVIPFHNEHWTTLLRSVTSVINRSPPSVLKEVILTDDYSNKDFLKKPLDDFVAKHWPDGKVKIVRAPKREGLIRTRILGAKKATGDVLIFLDSHVEANVNWLPPLLDPIARLCAESVSFFLSLFLSVSLSL